MTQATLDEKCPLEQVGDFRGSALYPPRRFAPPLRGGHFQEHVHAALRQSRLMKTASPLGQGGTSGGVVIVTDNLV
jgi:hypothetical protein